MDHSERQKLRDILKDIHALMAETRKARQELNGVKKELDTCYQDGEVTELGYHLRLEQINRSHQNINFCMRKLEHQKKVALQKLRDLE